jgi:hypothetical protein
MQRWEYSDLIESVEYGGVTILFDYKPDDMNETESFAPIDTR